MTDPSNKSAGSPTGRLPITTRPSERPTPATGIRPTARPSSPPFDFESMILPAQGAGARAPDPFGRAPAAGRPTPGLGSAVPPPSSAALTTTARAPVTPTPAAPVAAIQAPAPFTPTEPEHFKRTLIAAARATPVRRSGGGTSGDALVPSIIATPTELRRGEPLLFLAHQPESPQAASFRVLRYRLSERGDPRVIVVTSAEAGEGKTTCAINLALSLSECGRARVLLLEANLRRPGLARMLGLKPPRCVAQQISDHQQQPYGEPWQMAEVASPWLHVLAVDPTSFTRPRTIDEPALAHAISELKQIGYDYLVLDAPPVLGSADVNLLQELADGVLFTLCARRSNTRALERAVEQLTDAKVVGSVLLDR